MLHTSFRVYLEHFCCVQTTDGLLETVRDLQEKNQDLTARLTASRGLRDALSIAQSKVAEGELVQQV